MEAGARLQLGRVVATTSLISELRLGDEPDQMVLARDLWPLVERHLAGDWGEINPCDRRVNEQALRDGARVLSAYTVRTTRVWVITDGETDVCPACWAGIGICEPDLGEWVSGVHFRADLKPRRLTTTVLRPVDY